MAKKYEHVDFTYLLDELQGNTALAVDEAGLDIKIVEGKADKITQTEDVMFYEDSLIVVSEMIQHVIRPYEMYLPHVETVLELFKALEGRSLTNTKKIEKMLGLHDKKKRSRIITWLNEIKNAINEGNDYNVEFFCERLCEKTDLCAYVRSFTGKEPYEEVIDIIPAPKPESMKLHRILSDEKIKFVYSNKTLTIHDKSCSRVKLMDDEELNSSEEYLQGYVACPKCELKAYIRAGAKDIKSYDEYIKLFNLMGADRDLIKRMYLGLKFKTQLSHMHTEGYKYSNLTDNAITVWYREDTWRIGVTDKDRVRLEHNNYKRIKGGAREFVPGFHIQSDRTHSAKIDYALDVIRDYRFESHLAMQPIRPKDTPVFPPKAYEYVPKASTETKVPDPVVKSLKNRFLDFLRRTIFRDKIRKARYISEDSMPENNEICLYLWVDEQGNARWSSGIYISSTKEFAVSYRQQRTTTSIDKVIKWVPLDEINAI